MTPDEKQMLASLFERVGGASGGPRDSEAESLINDAMRATPGAAYVLTQTVLVQQQALEAAAKRLSDLEAQVKSAPPQQETSFLGNIGRSIFGGGSSQPAPPAPRGGAYDARAYEQRDTGPPPGYAPQRPGYAPPPPGYAAPPPSGPWGAPSAPPQGGGFLSGALQTATGVAGGVLLGNALGGLLGGHGGGLFGGGLGGGGLAPRETVNETNNYYESAPDAAGQHAQDVLQDQDQDQDAQQDAFDDGDTGGGSNDDYA